MCSIPSSFYRNGKFVGFFDDTLWKVLLQFNRRLAFFCQQHFAILLRWMTMNFVDLLLVIHWHNRRTKNSVFICILRYATHIITQVSNWYILNSPYFNATFLIYHYYNYPPDLLHIHLKGCGDCQRRQLIERKKIFAFFLSFWKLLVPYLLSYFVNCITITTTSLSSIFQW